MTPLGTGVDSELVTWLARLPFLAVEDLALLMGRSQAEIEAFLREMDHSGWTEWIEPSSSEIDADLLSVLTEPARRWVANQLYGPPGQRAAELPLFWYEISYRLARLETTVVLNIFAADLVASVRGGAELKVWDFRALPYRRPAVAWWPPGVQAYGCLVGPLGYAPFFVAVDRVGVPAAHRRALVASWSTFRGSCRTWGGDDIPPILVICPEAEQEDEWVRAVSASADRRKRAPLRVLLTHRSREFSDNPCGELWRTGESRSRLTFERRLTWTGRQP